MQGFTHLAQTQLFLTLLAGGVGWESTSIFIWIYTLMPPLQRSASSICVYVFWGEEVGTAGLSKGWFVSPPLEMIIYIWSRYPTDLSSNVTLPLPTWLCSVSHMSCLMTLSPGGFTLCDSVLLAA